MSTPDFEHLLKKARDAAAGGHDAWRVQSTGEKLAVALVLNRADWLAEMQYTLAEAIDRVGMTWIRYIRTVERIIVDETLAADE
ncbi:MAG: hypothetical protein ABIW82_17370 [Dokdonella sp.]